MLRLFFLALLSGPLMADLVDISMINPRIKIDLQYASDKNFTGEVLYSSNKCLLQEAVARHLSAVQDELEARGLGLLIWDGYRPLSVQKKLWDIILDERYVSNPEKGGRHTRGTSVDLTLITGEGEPLLMPCSYNEFSKKAHSFYMGVSEEALRNRAFLREIMQKHGFVSLETQWWHFDFHGWENFDPLE